MKKNWWFNDSTSKARAVIAYMITITICLVLAIKFLADGMSTDAVIIFSVVVGFVILYFIGMALKAPIFGKNTISWYRFDNYNNSEGVKMIDAKILSNYYGYSEGESRIIVEQNVTNKLLEEQNKLLNDIKHSK